MYFQKSLRKKGCENSHIFLLFILSLLILISAESFCADNDSFDNNGIPDFLCQYSDIPYQRYDQVTFIAVQSPSNKFSSTVRNPLFSRSPPR